MGEEIPSKLCGRLFDGADLERMRAEIVAANPPLRSEIARRVCRMLDWTDAMGRPKPISARVGLLRLHRAGLSGLPPPSGSNGNWRPSKRGPARWPEEVPVAGSVGHARFAPLAGERSGGVAAVERPDRSLPLPGYTPVPGALLRYLVESDQGALGTPGFGAATWKVAARDHWIGWQREAREAHLGRMLNSARLILLPRGRVKNLASKVLSPAATRWGTIFPHAMASGWCCWRRSSSSLAIEATATARPTGATSVTRAGAATRPSPSRDTADEGDPCPPTERGLPRRIGGGAMSTLAPALAAKIDLGDRRLNRRAGRLLETWGEKPTPSIPGACNGWDGTRAVYRLFDRESVTAGAVPTPHLGCNEARLREHPRVLCIEETSELDVTTKKGIAGLGPLNYERRWGLNLHPTLAITPERVPPGLLNHHGFTREPGSSGQDKDAGRALEEQGTVRWGDGFAKVNELAENALHPSIGRLRVRQNDFYRGLFDGISS